MQSLNYYLSNPRAIVAGLVFHTPFLFPDKLYLKIMFWAQMGYKLNLNKPTTFSEKLQWLKLYDRNPQYTELVDKLKVKDYVANILGCEYVIPTHKVWNNIDEIDISELPDQFVLKSNCGGGSNGVVVCKDKSSFDLSAAKAKLKQSIKEDIYLSHREWPYKNIVPKLFAEQFMVDESGYELKDYKFFCFNGEVKALFIATDRYKGEHNVKFDYYDAEFKHLDIRQSHPNAESPMRTPPDNFEEMKEVARTLSKGLKHVRIDLYNINGKIYFGEYTFYHYSGLMPFHPYKWDEIWGGWLNLNL